MSTDETPKKKRHVSHGKSKGRGGGNGLFGWSRLVQNNEAGTRSFYFQRHTVGATVTPHDGLYDIRLQINGPKKHLDTPFKDQDAENAMDILGKFNREFRWLIDPEHYDITEPEYIEEQEECCEKEEIQFEYKPRPRKEGCSKKESQSKTDPNPDNAENTHWGPILPIENIDTIKASDSLNSNNSTCTYCDTQKPTQQKLTIRNVVLLLPFIGLGILIWLILMSIIW